ncbi:hypothetical protein F4859DRAFT_440801 [Xylaria cf. heliscus]|nr:hypothetical protein F4859DRAFT_440801 [Xylaria cf. heliscus]
MAVSPVLIPMDHRGETSAGFSTGRSHLSNITANNYILPRPYHLAYHKDQASHRHHHNRRGEEKREVISLTKAPKNLASINRSLNAAQSDVPNRLSIFLAVPNSSSLLFFLLVQSCCTLRVFIVRSSFFFRPRTWITQDKRKVLHNATASLMDQTDELWKRVPADPAFRSEHCLFPQVFSRREDSREACPSSQWRTLSHQV